MSLVLTDRAHPIRFLIQDRDTKFTSTFDEVIRSQGIRIIRTQIQTPRANAFAERFVGTVRREYLDRRPIFGRRHLEHVLAEYIVHYKGRQSRRSLGQLAPFRYPVVSTHGQHPRSPIRHASKN